MTKEVFYKAIEETVRICHVQNHKELTISLYGGETLSNKKVIFDGINFFKDSYLNIKLHWIINTNGSLLKEEDVLFFKQHNVEIHISVDGPEEIHNLSRPTHKGKGTFQKVALALALIKKHRPISQINSYIMPSNYLHLKEIVDIAYEYGITKIYLDLFYNLEMFSFDFGLKKYIEVYYHAQRRNILVTGPWSRVLENQLNQIDIDYEYNLINAIEVNIDGSFYFPRIENSKKLNLHINSLFNYIQSSQFNLLNKELFQERNKTCQSCELKSTCFGVAIEQVHYHVGSNADTNVSCQFYKEWLAFLNRPLYFDNHEKLNVVSLIPIEEAHNLINKINQLILELENTLFPLEGKIHLSLTNTREDFHGASGYSSPNWSIGTTDGKSTLIYFGTEISKSLKHELVHLFIGTNNIHLPQWFNEGICEYFQGMPIDQSLLIKGLTQNNLLEYLIRENKLISDIRLIDMDDSNISDNVLYVQAHFFITDLVKKYGTSVLIHFLIKNKDGNFKENFLAIFKKDFQLYCFEFYTKTQSYEAQNVQALSSK